MVWLTMPSNVTSKSSVVQLSVIIDEESFSTDSILFTLQSPITVQGYSIWGTIFLEIESKRGFRGATRVAQARKISAGLNGEIVQRVRDVPLQGQRAE